MSRKNALSLYHSLYSLAPHERSNSTYQYPLCVYCGAPADSVDHVPPISRVDDYRAMRPTREQYLLVKSCRPCNSMLGDSLQHDILERFEYAKDLLRKKVPKGTPYWEAEELEALGSQLRSWVGSSIRKKDSALERYEYVGGLRALLGYTGQDAVIIQS